VPDITGKTPEDAAKALSDAAGPVLQQLGLPDSPPGLVIGAQSYIDSQQVAGTVIDQDPDKQIQVPIFSTVAVSIAKTATVVVPRIIGLNTADAAAKLNDAGLVFGKAISSQSSAPLGTVISQQPDDGRSVTAGTAVTPTVATLLMVTVPMFIGGTLAAAREAAAALQLKLKVSAQGIPDEQGRVAEQNIGPGSIVPVTTEINIFAASLPPDLIITAASLMTVQGQAIPLRLDAPTQAPSTSRVRFIQISFNLAVDPATMVTVPPAGDPTKASVLVQSDLANARVVPGVLQPQTTAPNTWAFTIQQVDLFPKAKYGLTLFGTRDPAGKRPFISQPNTHAPLAGTQANQNHAGQDVRIAFELT
jgi:beta-lactam-binding protein with PASTA domain